MTLNSQDPLKQRHGQPAGDEVDRQGCMLMILGCAAGALIPVLCAVVYFVRQESIPYLVVWLVNRGPLAILALVILVVAVYKPMETIDKRLGGCWAIYVPFRKFMEGRLTKTILNMLFGLSVGLLFFQFVASFIPKY